jgi:hypothetical protein
MRVYLRLRADNLPETGKRQYENKGDVRAHLDAKRKRESLCRLFSAKRNALRISLALQHRNG